MTAPVVALFNSKGGVGKTSIALGLAGAAALAGKRVLVVDADTEHRTASETLRPSGVDGTVRAGEGAWYGLGITTLQDSGELPATDGFDLVFVDCPPHAADDAIRSVLLGADLVLVPTQPHKFSFDGVARALTMLEGLNSAQKRAVVVNMADSTSESRARVEELQEVLGEAVWGVIPRRAAVYTAQGALQPVQFLSRPVHADIDAAFEGLLAKITEAVNA